jgi:hypothetical protein
MEESEEALKVLFHASSRWVMWWLSSDSPWEHSEVQTVYLSSILFGCGSPHQAAKFGF